MNRIFTFSAAAVLSATSLAAQETPNTILVLDGSGSMWGQIDGVAKISIAQDVVGDLLGTIPDDQGLGLTVYGHRERGNCTDIETVVAPATGTADAIRDAVSGIKPLGKTPMTDAVIAAAEALRYTEDKATVILVSDGVETCNPDPCAAARLLEEAGIDFTAHVIGFDVGSDAEALAQMQCIANETGGEFLTADNANQLSEALTQVAAAPDPEPVLTSVTFEARFDTEDGPLVDGPVTWSFDPQPEGIEGQTEGNSLTYDFDQGSYVATAYWVAGEAENNAQFIATGDERTVIVLFETPAQTAAVIAPTSAPLGSTIEVGWNGPNGEGDYIGIGAADATGAERWKNFAYTQDGNPVSLLVPPVEGQYVIRYFTGGDLKDLGSAELTATPVEVAVIAPAEAEAGSTISVGWDGPDYASDYIGIGKADATGADQWQNYAYTETGNPSNLLVPAEPGDYVIRYFAAQDQTELASADIKVVDVQATVTAPSEAAAGATISVEWTGPDYERDYIGIGKADATGSDQWQNYAYTETGSPLNLIVPTEPGAYVIRYFQAQDQTALFSTEITVNEVVATIDAPAEAVAGSTIDVGWTGPDYPDDFLGIGKAGETGSTQWENYTYTRDGSPAQVMVPTEPGDYLIKYFVAQGFVPLKSVPITVTAAKAQLIAEPSAPAGSELVVAWDGPDYAQDYIGVGKVDATGSQQWQTYAYTSDGNPVTITLPDEAGEYVIRYFLAQDQKPIASLPLAIE